MVVGVCRVSLYIHESASLKDKRQALKGALEKLRDRFNVSVAETGDHDLWQRAELGFAAVGNDRATVNSAMDKALNFLEALHVAEIIDSSIEIISL